MEKGLKAAFSSPGSTKNLNYLIIWTVAKLLQECCAMTSLFLSIFSSSVFSLIKNCNKYIVLPVMFLIAFFVAVQPAGAENLMDVYNLALENDPAFQGQGARNEASKEVVKQAKSGLMPQLSADYYYKNTSQKIYDTDIAIYGVDKTSYSSKGYGLTLTQPIFEYSSIVRLKQAKEEVKGSDMELEAARQDLILRVAEAYIGALQAEDGLGFAKAEEDALTRHFELAKERYSNGLAPITDFHDAKASLASMSAGRTVAESELDDAMEGIVEIAGKKISGLKGLKTTRATGDIKDSAAASKLVVQSGLTGVEMPLVKPDPDTADAWEEAARTQNLHIKVMEQKVLVAEKEVERQKGERYPTLNLVGTYNRDTEGGSLYGGDSDLSTREAILQLNIPIYQGGSVSSRVREAKKLADAARKDLEKEVRLAKREARAAFLGVKSAITNTDALMQSMVSYQIALEAKKEGFKSGLFPSLSVVDAERDLYSAKKDYSRSQYEYILNGLRLQKAAGTLSQEDLEEINRWLETN